jgi:hypothetical protein
MIPVRIAQSVMRLQPPVDGEVIVTVLLVSGASFLTRVLAVREQFYPALFSVLSAIM